MHLKLNSDEWNIGFLALIMQCLQEKMQIPPKKVTGPKCLKWIKVIQLYFKFLIRQHSAPWALLMVLLWRGFYSSAQESIHHHAPAPATTQKECILNPFCAAVLFPWCFFHAPTAVTTWLELEGIFDSTLPPVDWVCISRDKHLQYSEEQMLQ